MMFERRKTERKPYSSATRRVSLQGVVDIVNRNHAGAEQTVRIGGAEIMQPVVVGARHRRGEARILIGKGEDAQATRRKQHGGVDALGVHRFQLHLAGPAALGVIAVDVLVLVEIATAMRRAAGAPRVARALWEKSCRDRARSLRFGRAAPDRETRARCSAPKGRAVP